LVPVHTSPAQRAQQPTAASAPAQSTADELEAIWIETKSRGGISVGGERVSRSWAM
jgi:hypothetical protein